MILYGKWHSVAVTWCSIAAIQLPLPPKLGRNKGGVTQERKKTAIGLSPKRCKIWPRLLYDGLIGNKSYTRFRLEKKIEVWCGPHHTSFSNSHHTSFEKEGKEVWCGCGDKKVWYEFGKEVWCDTQHTSFEKKCGVNWAKAVTCGPPYYLLMSTTTYTIVWDINIRKRQDAMLSQGEPRDVAISFDTTASCMRLLWYSMGFLYRPTWYISNRSNAGLT